jgi:prefoldin beta subunit
MKTSDSNLQELNFLEQNMQNILLQKQAFQMEISETTSALNEIKKSSDEVFKIIGQLMIKANKSEMISELENKEKLLKIKLDSLDKQENSLNEKIISLRDEVLN